MSDTPQNAIESVDEVYDEAGDPVTGDWRVLRAAQRRMVNLDNTGCIDNWEM